MSRPMIFALVVGGSFAVIGLSALLQRIVWRYQVRRDRLRKLEEWTALAQQRGFEISAAEDEVVMRGFFASRSFQLDSLNFFGYGMDVENALRFSVEDADARFAITGWNAGDWTGALQPPSGNEAFDAHYKVRANPAGLRFTDRLGPDERRLLVEHQDLDVVQSHGEARIRLPYRIQPADLDAALRLMASLWDPPPLGTSPAPPARQRS